LTTDAMRVLVTRPAAQAHEWARDLVAAGIVAVPLPLIEIVPPADPAAVTAAWQALADYQLALFVSPNAVGQFFALRPPGAAWPPLLSAASPGPGTTETLRQSGVPEGLLLGPAIDAPQYDSESLWAVLGQQDWQGKRALLLRGATGRDWLEQQLRERGARVDALQVYRRMPPAWTTAEHERLRGALADPSGHVWLFSSSEAIDQLETLAPEADWSRARAVTSHPRIAARAVRLGIGTLHEVKPTLASVIACIQSIAS
jgi:uroporphyrinogen-III synthase